MWYVAAVSGTMAAAAATAFAYRRHCRDAAVAQRRNNAPLPPMDRFEACRTVDDVVAALQDFGRGTSTEQLAERIVASAKAQGITEGGVARLSRMHAAHGADLGLRGYAVNFLWACIVEGIASGDVVIIVA